VVAVLPNDSIFTRGNPSLCLALGNLVIAISLLISTIARNLFNGSFDLTSYGYLWCMRKGEEKAYPAQ